MKLKRLISCGLVGILTGVGILMNAKVSSAEDKSVKFEFKSSTDSNTEITFDTFKKEVTSGNADLISNIKSTKVYAGKQGLKFGSSSKNGSLTFTLNQNYKINQFKVGIAKYNDKDGGKVKVQCGEYSEDFTPESSVLDFDGKSFTSYETNTFTISTTAKRAYVKSIEFLYNNAETCTVAYYDGADVISTFTVDKGTTLDETSKPANPEKEGYVFAGWYTDVKCTTAYDFNLPVNTDITLYAKFEDTSIIRLNGYTFNKISTLEGLTTGYYVIGGYISNSNEYKYMISDMNTTKSFKSSDNPTEFYEIKLKGNSVTIKNSKNMYIISNTEKSVSLSEKEKTIFTPVVNADGFKLKVTGSLNFQFNPSAKIFTSYTSKQQDLTLFKAQNVKPFYVTFKGPNNEELNKEEMLPHQKAPEFEAPNKPGHKFMGWYNEATGAKYDFTTELSEETVLVAKYEALTPAELFEQLEIKNQLAYHWQTEDGTTYTIDNVSLRFGVNLTEEMKSLEGVKFGAILAKKVDVANINLSEYARECTSAAEVVAGDPNLKYLEFTNIAAEGGMTSLRLDNLDSAIAEEFVVVIYMEYNGKLYVTEQKIASVKVIASEYLDKKVDLDLTDDQIKSLNQLSK